MAIAWLAVVRATVSVVLLAATQSIEFNGFAFALLVVGCAGIVVTWPLASYLMEDAWNAAAPKQTPTTWQELQFIGDTPGKEQTRQPVTGPLILTSMSVGNACRVWVSEIELMPEASETAASSLSTSRTCPGRGSTYHRGKPHALRY